MKMKNLANIGLLLTAFSGASLSGDLVSTSSNGIMELPTFYVYASDSESGDINVLLPVDNWQYRKKLDAQLEPVVIQVMTPGDQIQSVLTPGISVSLEG